MLCRACHYPFHFSDCNEEGSVGAVNNECICKDNFNGTKCDECAPGYYNFPTCQGNFEKSNHSFIINCRIKSIHHSYVKFQLVIVIYKGQLILLAMIMVNAVVKLISMVTNVIHVLQVIPSFHHAKVYITTDSNPV